MKFKIVITSFTLCLSIISCRPRISIDQNDAEFASRKKLIIPKTLYHWAKASSVQRLFASGETAPLKKISDSHFIGAEFKFLVGQAGLFTWSHPVSGMAASAENEAEVYAKPGTGDDAPKILIIQVNSQSRTCLAQTGDPDDKIELTQAQSKSCDLLYHVRLHFDEPWYQEWIILNSRAVKSMDYQGIEVKSLLTGELKQLKSKRKYSDEELHSKSFDINMKANREYAIEVVSSAIKNLK